MMNEGLGKCALLAYVYRRIRDFHAHALPGIAGNVRRYSAFVDDYLAPLIPVHEFITIAALLTGAAQFIFLLI